MKLIIIVSILLLISIVVNVVLFANHQNNDANMLSCTGVTAINGKLVSIKQPHYTHNLSLSKINSNDELVCGNKFFIPNK
jgi:hypothetical protein